MGCATGAGSRLLIVFIAFALHFYLSFVRLAPLLGPPPLQHCFVSRCLLFFLVFWFTVRSIHSSFFVSSIPPLTRYIHIGPPSLCPSCCIPLLNSTLSTLWLGASQHSHHRPDLANDSMMRVAHRFLRPQASSAIVFGVISTKITEVDGRST